MTKCDRCKKEVGPLFCGNCREDIQGKTNELRIDRMVKLLYYDQWTGLYHAGCNCLECPFNKEGICRTGHASLDSIKRLLHEYDGDNIIRQVCG